MVFFHMLSLFSCRIRKNGYFCSEQKPGNNTHRPIRAGGKQVGERVKEQTGKQTGRTGNGAGIHTGSGIH